MTTNVTLEIDESILEKAKHEADQRNRSLSQWLSELIEDAVADPVEFAAARRRAIERLQTGLDLDLGGKPLTREEIYAERIRLR
jgi:predicted transcriptional regulator